MGASALAAVARPVRAAGRAPFTQAQISDDLHRYVGFGIKASGGPGDSACGDWLAGQLAANGLKVERPTFAAPFFEPSIASLETGASRAPLIPQAVVVQTPPAGVTGPLAIRAAWTDPQARCDGAVAIVVLPHRRWSTATANEIRRPVQAAFGAGAIGVVIVTQGPTGEALALNAPGEALFGGPVAVLAPKDAAPFLAAAQRGEPGRLVLTGRQGARPAYNLVGRLDRGAGRTLVVSTPRSGWFTCAGERGGGVAAWLALLRWAPKALPRHDLVFLATSGHEYENLGAGGFLEQGAPPPASTALWLHLGANVAARDWSELGTLAPLPGADSQRTLMVTPDLEPIAAVAFRGQPGLERPLVANKGAAAGELAGILARGYPRVAGVFGAHRFHHAAADDGRCLADDATLAAAIGFRDLVARALA